MTSASIKYLVSSLILALVMTCATSARILDEEIPVAPVVVPEDSEIDTSPASSATPVATSTGTTATTGVVATTTGAATGAVAATTNVAATTGAAIGAPVVAATGAATTTGAVATTTDVAATTGAVAATTGAATTTGAVAATTGAATGAVAATAGAATGAVAGEAGHALTFFMHDILGGTTPSATAVTGVVNNPAVNGQVPFAKRNGANLPLNNGVQNNNNNNAFANNNNNVPFLTGLSGTTPNIMQNSNNNNGNNNFNGGFGFNQLPTGPALNKLMFGTMTVFDDELTEGHELGSGVVGKAQGFYVTSAQDGLSQTMAFTTMFEIGGYSDSLSFFGIHRTAVSESHLAIMGGTGKYVNAKGFAIVKTFPAINQHSGDGVETVLEINVYLSY